MLTVGENSYTTVANATEYINTHYPSTDPRRAEWTQLDESDQEIYLIKACAALNILPFMGVQYEAFQPLAWPRFLGVDYVMAYRELIAPEAYIYPEMQEIPSAIINAQIEEAFELACPSKDTARHDAQTGAVKSYSIGHLSETFRDVITGAENNLKSGAAQRLVKPYIGGCYELR